MGAIRHAERAMQKPRGFGNIVDIFGTSGDMFVR